jgi:mono/diheme cytochrome c family protein
MYSSNNCANQANRVDPPTRFLHGYRVFRLIPTALLVLVFASLAQAQEPDAQALYGRVCAPCHGLNGRGEGPAAWLLSPAPRDFTRGEYKWRTTPSGSAPTDSDLEAAIRFGAPGTSMPAFDRFLTAQQIDGLVAIVKGFAPKSFRRAAVAVPVVMPNAPLDAAAGQLVYEKLGCAACHGVDGKGDGPSAKGLKDASGRAHPPFNLRKDPLRRPLAKGGNATAAIYTTLVTGLTGTAMPSYQEAASETELWALSAYVQSFAVTRPQTENRDATVDGQTPSKQPPDELFPRVIPPQGPAPDELAPAVASLNAGQCGRCHAKQFREWRGSIHSQAMAPGVIAQLVPSAHAAKEGGFIESCQRCHAPLAEQQPRGAFDPDLRAQGINCAACHVRNWQRNGPPPVANTSLLSVPNYPFAQNDRYERADLCMSCHQLSADTAVNGKPRLNTYREWLEGPYMPRGIQCQNCHMPNREHTFLGIHHPETFRQGIAVETRSRKNQEGQLEVVTTVKNVGAGHYLPTTPTPAAWVSFELVDDDGDGLRGTAREKRIGWHLVFERGRWKEVEDTRIRPGESVRLTEVFSRGDAEDARGVRVRVRVAPDDFYQGFYERRLRQKSLTKSIREQFEQALERTRRSKYIAYDRVIPL